MVAGWSLGVAHARDRSGSSVAKEMASVPPSERSHTKARLGNYMGLPYTTGCSRLAWPWRLCGYLLTRRANVATLFMQLNNMKKKKKYYFLVLTHLPTCSCNDFCRIKFFFPFWGFEPTTLPKPIPNDARTLSTTLPTTYEILIL